VLPRSLAGFALSFGCGEHYWLSLKSRIYLILATGISFQRVVYAGESISRFICHAGAIPRPANQTCPSPEWLMPSRTFISSAGRCSARKSRAVSVWVRKVLNSPSWGTGDFPPFPFLPGITRLRWFGVGLDIENYCMVSLFFEQAYLSYALERTKQYDRVYHVFSDSEWSGRRR